MLSETRETVTLTVEDNGKGIKREHFENIFQTFFSYDEARHQTGTGIGLTLTKAWWKCITDHLKLKARKMN